MVSVFFMISWIGKKETGDLPPIYWEKKQKEKEKINIYLYLLGTVSVIAGFNKVLLLVSSSPFNLVFPIMDITSILIIVFFCFFGGLSSLLLLFNSITFLWILFCVLFV